MTCVYANQACHAFVSADSLIGRTFEDVLPELWADARPPLHAVARTGREWSKSEFPLKLGTTRRRKRYCDFTVSRLVNGDETYLSLRVRDVTKRVLDRRAAEEAAHKLAGAVERLADAFLLVGSDWRLSFVNNRGAEMFHATEEDLFGRDIRDIVPDAVRGTFESGCRRALEDRVPATFDAYCEPFDTWVEVRTYPVDGGAAVYCTDITERKHAERSMEEGQRSLLEELMRTIVLQEATTVATASFDLHSVADAVLHVMQERLAAKAGCVYLLDDSNHLRPLALLGYPDESLEAAERIPLDDTTTLGRALLARTTITHDDPRRVRNGGGGFPATPRSGRWMMLPIESKGVILGGMALAFPGRRPFAEQEYALCHSVSQQLGAAMENARLFGELRETTRLGDALDDINEVLHASMRTDELLRSATSLAADALGSETAAAWLVEDGAIRRVWSMGFPPDAGTRDEVPLDRAPAACLALQRGEVVASDEVSADRRFLPGEAGDSASALVLPLRLRERAFGVLTFGFDEVHCFSDAELDFAHRLSSAVSLAMETVRLYENERFIAETLQESLLSLPEDVEGIEIAHLYHSATQEARVGGDFYDVFELHHGHVGVLIGDVSGKGVHAAVLTSLVKNTLRAYAAQRELTPAEVVRRTSDTVYRESASDAFVTLLFGMLDRRDGRLVYCSAGHTPAVIVRRDGSMASLPANSPFAGAFADAPFDQAVTRLDVGDTLLLYTDGIVEARSESEFFGEERLIELVCGLPEIDLWTCAHAVLDDVLRFTGGALNDDVALLALRRTEEPVLLGTQLKLPLSIE